MKTLLLLIYCLFFTIISFGQTYQKVSPTPSEVQYNDIAFADSLNVWVVGEEGTILHSTDRGEVWEIKPSLTDANLKRVFFQNPNRGWIVGGTDTTGVRLQTFDGGLNWSIDSTFQNSINDIFILENETGWMVGNKNLLFKTENNGDTWEQDSIIIEENINRIFFLNDTIGWIAGDKNLWYTTDGGMNWQIQNSVFGKCIRDVFFIDNNYGWVVGELTNDINAPHYVGLLVTEDGGNTWSARLPATKLESVLYLSKEKGWIVGKAIGGFQLFGKTIFQTKDTNMPSNQNLDHSISKYNLPSVDTLNKQFTLSKVIEDRGEIWTIGGQGVILKKGIDGEYWDCKTNVTNNLFAVQYVTPEIAWAVGHRGFIVKSIDGGITWEEEPQFTNETLLDLVFVTENIAYTVGSKGQIWKTTNGGDNWNSQLTNITQHLKSISFINENIGWAVGSDGVILHTKNGGELWEIQNMGSDSILNKVQFIDENFGFAIGNPSVYLTTKDGGENWVNDSIPYISSNTELNLTDIHFFGRKEGMLTFGNGFYDFLPVQSGNNNTLDSLDINYSTYILNTVNGSNWNLEIDSFLFGSLNLFGNLEKGINTINMFDRNNGIMAGRRVFISKGDSLKWERLDIQNEDIVSTWQDIDCYDKNNCLVVGIKGNILKIENDYILTDNNNINTTSSNIKVFPNPTDGKVICQNIEEIDQINVFDFQGRLIKQISVEVNASTSEFSLDKFTPGIYLLNFMGKEKTQNVKVVLF